MLNMKMLICEIGFLRLQQLAPKVFIKIAIFHSLKPNSSVNTARKLSSAAAKQAFWTECSRFYSANFELCLAIKRSRFSSGNSNTFLENINFPSQVKSQCSFKVDIFQALANFLNEPSTLEHKFSFRHQNARLK